MTDGQFPRLRSELSRWESLGLKARFWLRDDDATRVTPHLQRLHELAESFDCPVGLAVIPLSLDPDLVCWLAECDGKVIPMCHGFAHTNHGTHGIKEEFGDSRPRTAVLADAREAYKIFSRHFGSTPAFFVPPFSMLAPKLEDDLLRLGFDAVSNEPSVSIQRFARLHSRVARLPTNFLSRFLPEIYDPTGLHVHVDFIDWASGTARPAHAIEAEVVGELRLRRKQYVRSDAPIGLLTHHLVHDEAIWNSVASLLSDLRASTCAEFPDLGVLMRAACKKNHASQETPKGHQQSETLP